MDSSGAEARGRACGRVVILFRAALGLVFLAAFLSLAVQLSGLAGSRGLLPLHPYLARVQATGIGLLERLHQIPTLFWLDDSDALLTALPLLGAILSILLVAGLGGRAVVALLWVLYLSCIVAGRDFFFYQWDNLLLETSLVAILLPGAGRTRQLLRPLRPPPEPSRVIIVLLRWLLFRLLFESALAKIVYGPDDWLTLRAMTYYYETAPLPSWGGWLVQQSPRWFHQLSAVITLLSEGLLPFFIFARARALRLGFFMLHALFQASIVLTSNYGWFNLLAVALSLVVLDDADLEWLRSKLRRRRPERKEDRPSANRESPAGGADRVPVPGSPPAARSAAAAWIFAALVLPASVLEGWAYFDRAPLVSRILQPIRSLYAPFRSVNVYHLFPGVVRERIVAEIEGSTDGVVWFPLRLRDAPGDPSKAPPTTLLHNPRLPFTYSFLTLGRGGRDVEYMHHLVERICCDPHAIAPFMEPGPFRDAPPKRLRVTYYRYRFGNLDDLRRTGTYWLREPIRPPTDPLTCSCPSGP